MVLKLTDKITQFHSIMRFKDIICFILLINSSQILPADDLTLETCYIWLEYKLCICLSTCVFNYLQSILEEIANADSGAPCSPQHLKKVFPSESTHLRFAHR